MAFRVLSFLRSFAGSFSFHDCRLHPPFARVDPLSRHNLLTGTARSQRLPDSLFLVKFLLKFLGPLLSFLIPLEQLERDFGAVAVQDKPLDDSLQIVRTPFQSEVLAIHVDVLDQLRISDADQRVDVQQQVSAAMAEKLQDALNKVQETYYNIGAEISKTEQNIKHQQDLQQRQQTDMEQIEEELEKDATRLQEFAAGRFLMAASSVFSSSGLSSETYFFIPIIQYPFTK